MIVGFLCHETHAPVGFAACQACADNLAPCGLAGPTIRALIDTVQPRAGLHVSDLLGCAAKVHFDRQVEAYEYPLRYKAILVGQSFHHYVAGFAPPDALVEHTLTAEFVDTTITGTPDLYVPSTRTLLDFKTTNTIYRKLIPYGEHIGQLQLYRWLLEANGHPVERAMVYYLALDKPKCKACRRPVQGTLDGAYYCSCGAHGRADPGAAVVPVRLWDDAALHAFLLARLDAVADGRRVEPKDEWKCGYCAYEQICKKGDAHGQRRVAPDAGVEGG